MRRRIPEVFIISFGCYHCGLVFNLHSHRFTSPRCCNSLSPRIDDSSSTMNFTHNCHSMKALVSSQWQMRCVNNQASSYGRRRKINENEVPNLVSSFRRAKIQMVLNSFFALRLLVGWTISTLSSVKVSLICT